jgi:hypothetical protein
MFETSDSSSLQWPERVGRTTAQLIGLTLVAWASMFGFAHGQVQRPANEPAADCRIAFDMGSSGMRAAASGAGEGVLMPSRDLDLLTPLMQGQRLELLLPAVESALRELPQQARLPVSCRQMGGGFSAWRLAWKQDGVQLSQHLEALREHTGVAVLVIPAAVEGRYGHDSAKQALGLRLQTSHILDIGGGSMQVAGHERSFGIELGQKSWAHQLCQTLGRDTGAACQLLPLNRLELQQARELASQQLQALPAEVGTGTLTAISRPVTRGIRSALRSLGVAQGESISAQELSMAIDKLSPMALADVVQLTGLTVNFAPFLVSDMLLVEAVMRAMKLSTLALAETAINNLPALLRDERAFAWSQRHPCYVQRLRELGPAAYFSDPAGCAKP